MTLLPSGFLVTPIRYSWRKGSQAPLYLYDEAALDIDNILKPIQDALVGIVLEDDSVITDVEIRRRWRQTTFTLNVLSPVLATGLALGHEFRPRCAECAPAQDVLP
jgi:hypothetical protein